VATGDLRRPTRRQRRRIEAAVREAEATTGLQLCVYLGVPGDGDHRTGAEAVFVEAGLTTRPAVLLVVDPPHRHVEVVTGSQVVERISDADAADAVARMAERFAEGDLVGGVIAGVEHLAAVAGPGTAAPGDTDLPDVMGG
jgi:uncharacterized membrane protein YgcG